MKKICHMLCLVFIIMYTSGPVMAYSGFMEILGEVTLLEEDTILVTGIGLTENARDEVILYTDEAEIYDLKTGFAIKPSDIYEGDCVRVIYEADTALEIYVHAGEQGAADFMVVVSDNIWYSDDSCTFVTIDGKYRITLESGTLLLDEYGYEISAEEIIPGMEMFVWAAFVTASFPGQVIPDKVVLLG